MAEEPRIQVNKESRPEMAEGPVMEPPVQNTRENFATRLNSVDNFLNPKRSVADRL
jgi:hypothetical protein